MFQDQPLGDFLDRIKHTSTRSISRLPISAGEGAAACLLGTGKWLYIDDVELAPLLPDYLQGEGRSDQRRLRQPASSARLAKTLKKMLLLRGMILIPGAIDVTTNSSASIPKWSPTGSSCSST